MKSLFKYFFMLVIGGLGYMSLEVLFRGHSHWSMGVTGGLCFIALYLIEVYSGEVLWRKCVMGAVVITTLEFLVGITVNLIFDWNVWDYSTKPLNLMGQICPEFTAVWLVVSAGGLWLGRMLYNLELKLEREIQQS